MTNETNLTADQCKACDGTGVDPDGTRICRYCKPIRRSRDALSAVTPRSGAGVPAGTTDYPPLPKGDVELVERGLNNRWSTFSHSDDQVRRILAADRAARGIAAVPAEPVQWTTWVSGGIPCFTIGNQSFKLDYDNSDGTAEWMRSMLEKALSRLAAQVSASVPSTHVLVPRILPVEMLRAVDGTHEDKYVARGRVVEIWDLLLSALPGGQQGEK